MIKCPRCGYQVKVEYDIWDNSYWVCYHCGLLSHQLVTYSNNTTAASYIQGANPRLPTKLGSLSKSVRR